MTSFLLPVLYTLFVWWFSTGAILYLDGLPKRTFPWTMRGATIVLAAAFYGLFATMYVRDHARPEFHKALGFDPTDYDFGVFRITSEISRQVFPLTLALEDPRFRAGLDRLVRIGAASDAAKAQGGIVGGIKRLGLAAAAGATLLRLYILPARANALPADIRLAPTW